MDLHPGAHLGNYVIEEPLAAGGFGRVYRATQTGPGGFECTVAIKVLRRSVQHRSDVLDLFFREARTIALLNHRNIVHVHEFAEEQGLYFLVLEHIDGVPLSRLDPAREGMPPWLALGIAAEIARALVYAHGLRDEPRGVQGVVHRDIKPSNVLVSVQGDVKVSDFGLARMLGADPASRVERAPTGALRPALHGSRVAGTPAYMSPEQLRGEQVTAKSDVFSLGLLLLRLCRGSVPSREDTGGAVDDEVLSEIGSPALATILRTTLEFRAADRPAAMELERSLAAYTTQMAPPGAELAGELAQRVLAADSVHHASAGATLTASLGAKVDDLAPQLEPATRASESDPTVANGPVPPGSARSTRARTLLGATVALVVIASVVGLVLVGRHARTGPATNGRNLAVPAADARHTDVPPTTRDTVPAVVPAQEAAHVHDSATPAAPRHPRARGLGFLSVNARPWATGIYLDGRRIGITPLFRHRVPGGRHVIRLIVARGTHLDRRVHVRRGRELNLGLIVLDSTKR